MNRIQIITYNKNKIQNIDNQIAINDLNDPESLDDFDINIIDISNKGIWYSESKEAFIPQERIICSNDFSSINKMIKNSKQTTIIICLPQNVEYTCEHYNNYTKVQLKDCMHIYSKVLLQLIPTKEIKLMFEKSITNINGNQINSAFHFIENECEIITKSNISCKSTTVKIDNIYLTTLNLFNHNNTQFIKPYLEKINLINTNIVYPEWLRNYCFNDDDIQNKNIENANKEIEKQKETIKKSEIKLESNLYYKSILYNNSDKLVDVVFKIIESIFDVDLSKFVDKKNEDFLFKKDGYTFIGEIKGINTNIKNENISQLDIHYSKYLDKLEEEGIEERVIKLLIINYEREKPIDERDEIHANQINLAFKKEILIITSEQLLKIYEKILTNSISKKDLFEYFVNNVGVVDLTKISK